jgi:hypothetical protein
MRSHLVLAVITLCMASAGAAVGQTTIYPDMPTVVAAGVRHYLPPSRPTDAQIVGAVGGDPAKDQVMRIEVVEHRVGPASFYPLVGQAQLSSARFRCEISTATGSKVVVVPQDVLVLVR